jgi:hypothetical protein
MLVLALIYGSSFFHGSDTAQASVAMFHPGHCLGGWKNVDKIAGQPEVRPDNNAQYDDTNSASLFNANAQVFCGGFVGDIPYAAKHERVTLNFSWYIDDGPQPERVPSNNEDESVSQEAVEISPVQEVAPEAEDVDAVKDTTPELEDGREIEGETRGDVPKEMAPEPIPPEPTEPTAFRFLNMFIHTAEAQEEIAPESVGQSISEEAVVSEEVVENVDAVESPAAETESTDVATTTVVSPENGPDILADDATLVVPSPVRTEEEQQAIEEAYEKEVIDAGKPEDAYFEVLYTLDGEDWHTLGYVNRIANDVQIELPIDLFATVEDLKKVQIALHTVERFDTVPKIYLDSLWLEVSYDDVVGAELAPPGKRPGDLIFSETTYQDSTAVVVLRNVELMTLSNVLTAASSTATSSQSGQADVDNVQATTSASSTDQATVLTSVVSTSTLADIINSTGVLVELWLHASSTDEWSRIADDSIISRNPQVKFVDGSIFWVDKSNESVWRYNPKSGGYDALSFSEGQSSKMQFRNESGELRELDFSFGTSSVHINTVSEPEME